MISKNAMQNFLGINQHFSIEENEEHFEIVVCESAFFHKVPFLPFIWWPTAKKKYLIQTSFPAIEFFSHDFYLVPNIFLLFAEKIQVHEPKGRVIKERHLQMGIVLAS